MCKGSVLKSGHAFPAGISLVGAPGGSFPWFFRYSRFHGEEEFAFQISRLQESRSRSGDDHQIARRLDFPLMAAKKITQAALGAIAYDGFADFAADGEAQARPGVFLLRPAPRINNKRGTRITASLPEDFLKLLFGENPPVGRETLVAILRRTGGHNGSRSAGHADAAAALLTAPRQHLAAPAGRHACAESVLLHTAAVVWLKCSFHSPKSFRGSLRRDKKPAPPPLCQASNHAIEKTAGLPGAIQRLSLDALASRGY